MASAQAPDGGYYVKSDTPVPPPSDLFLIPPDTDIGIPIIGPPGFGDELLEETIVEVHVVIPLCDPDGLPEPPPLDYRPALCPLRKPPNDDQYTWLLADGWCNLEDPPPSTYQWLWPDLEDWTEPDSSEWGYYWSRSCGTTNQADVKYTVQDVGSDQATSGYIRVFDADLTLDDVPGDPQDTEEDDPGFVVAKGSGRMPFTLKFSPQDLNEVMPYNFLDGQPHIPPAPYTISLTHGSCVNIYSQPSGGTPLSGDALNWGWKWNVTQQKFIEQTPPYPTLLYVEPISAGYGDLNLRLEINNPAECWQWWTGPMPWAEDTVKITVTYVNLDFQNVPDPQDEYPGGFVGVGGLIRLDLSQVLPPGLPGTDKATLTWNDANKVKVIEDQNRTSQISSGKQYQLNQLPRSVYVEGEEASDEVRDVLFNLAYTKGNCTVSDTVKLTVLGIESVELSKPDGGLSANDHPTAPVGLKCYPDATQPGDVWHDQINVKATVKPLVPTMSFTVYFAVFDPDDPSADNNEVDQGILLGGDNRGGPGNLTGSPGLTDSNGEVTAYLTVAHRPGDNHRVAAVVLDQSLLSVLNNNNVPASDAQVPGFHGKLSPLLTVWRILHLDLDSMGPAIGNFVTGTVEDIQHFPNNNPPWTKVTLSDFPSNFEEEDHFEQKVTGIPKGKLALFKQGLPTKEDWVLKDEMHWGDDILYIPMDTSITTSYVGGDYFLKDDDWWALPDDKGWPLDLPHTLSTRILQREMKKAYVDVQIYDTQQNSPFQVNVDDYATGAEINLSTEGWNGSSQWWVAHLTAAFQGPASLDADEEHAFCKGMSEVRNDGDGRGGFVFLEVIREWVSWHANTFEQEEAETVAHEVGHQFGMDHLPYRPSVDDGAVWQGHSYIMAGEVELGEAQRFSDTFPPPSLRRIREVDHPIKDPED